MISRISSNILIFSVFLSISFTGFSQSYQLKGKVMDEFGTPVEYASVTILRVADSSYVNGGLADSLGVFQLQQARGSYLIRIESLGHLTFSKAVTLAASKDLQQITLETDALYMKEARVVASRPQIIREVDRLVFNIDNMVSAHGANAVELLQEVPGLRVDKSISVIGKGSVKVYINSREIKTSGEELINYLKSYSASDISRVEVITTPPASYDAEGNVGIVNIVLKKIPQDFIGGTITASEYYQSYKAIEAYRSYFSGNITYNKKRLSSFLNLNYGFGKSGYIEENDTYYTDQTWSECALTKMDYSPFNVRMGFDYELGKEWNVGIHAAYSKTPFDVIEPYRTAIRDVKSNEPVYLILGDSPREVNRSRKNINVHLDKEIDTLGKKMLWDVDYIYFDNQVDEQVYADMYDANHTLLPEERYGYKDDQSRTLNAIASSVDFSLPFSSFSITFGAKYSYAKTEYERSQVFETEEDLGKQHDYFEYKENIAALYADFSKKLSSKFDIKGGLRIENTETKGYSRMEKKEDKHSYLRLFPSAYIIYQPYKEHVFNLNFSNRIMRPAYNMVNPFRSYSNAYAYSEGKPDLKAYYTYNAELGYTFSQNLNISLFYSYADDVFDQIGLIDPETKIVAYKWDNYITQQKFGATNSYMLSSIKWMRINIQHGISYNKNESSYSTNPAVSGWVYFAELRNSFYFTSSRNFTGSLSVLYSSREYSGDNITYSNYQINAGLRYNMFKNKLSTSFTVNNLFNLSKSSGEILSNGVVMKFNNYYNICSYRLSISYHFGAKLSTKTRDYSSADIEDRL